AAMIVLQQAMALHHDDMQAIVRVGDDGFVLVGEQFVEHLPATARYLCHRHAPGESLRGIQLAESTNSFCWIRQAGAGKAPGADGGADQSALTRSSRQPVTEQCEIQTLNADAFRAASRAWQNADIRRAQAILANSRQGFGASL